MAFQPTPMDIAALITVAPGSGGPATGDTVSYASERRITPTWTVSQLKAKLETMTGIPPSNQKLKLKSPGREDRWVEGDDQLVGEWGLARGCEFEVCNDGIDVYLASISVPLFTFCFHVCCSHPRELLGLAGWHNDPVHGFGMDLETSRQMTGYSAP